MNIKRYLNSVQSYLVRKRIMFYFQFFVLFASLFLISSIFFESIFYFQVKIKIALIIIFLTSFLIFISICLFQLIQVKKNRSKEYQLESIAKDLGELGFRNDPDAIINAYQLESNLKKNESNELALVYITKIFEQVNKNDLIEKRKKKFNPLLKIYILSIWCFTIIFFSFNYSSSANAFYRLKNSTTHFEAPKPFQLISSKKNIHILGGEKVEIEIKSNKKIPDSVVLNLKPSQESTKQRDSLELNFISSPNEKGSYIFSLPELYQDYTYQAIVSSKNFWDSWDIVTSNADTIFVTDRPTLEKFQVTIIPPKYSRLPKKIQEGNNAVIQGLKGSKLQLDIATNKILKESYLLINKEKINLNTSSKNATGYHIIEEEINFSVNLVDLRGITNKNPILYKIEIVPDLMPSLQILEPSIPSIELGDEQIIYFQLNIQDDYGFSNLQIAYEIVKPSILELDPYVSMISIPELNKDSIVQNILYLWNLENLFLMPDDEVHFHIELTDNDIVSGPKKTISKNYIAKLPSLKSIYEEAEVAKDKFIEDISFEIKEVEKLREQFKILEMKALKTEKLNWEEQKAVKNSVQNAKDEIEKLENLSKAIEELTELADKHKLFSPELLNKFEELSNLLNNIIPKDMLQNMNDLEEALNNLDMDSIKESLNELTKNMDQVEKELERYLEIFKQIEMEQRLDELKNRMEQLTKQQKILDKELLQSDKKISDSKRLEIQEQNIFDEFRNVKSLLNETSDLIRPSNEKIAKSLENLSKSDLTKNINNLLEETIKNISKNNFNDAQLNSSSSIDNMEKMIEKIDESKKNFQKQSINEMTEKFQKIIQDILLLSSKQEKLSNSLDKVNRNSPRLRTLAARQQMLQDQLKSITSKMIELSKETFAITPAVGRGIGKASSGMNLAKAKLANREIKQAQENKNIAMEGLNEIAFELHNNMKEMQKSGSASGMEQFMKMLQDMADQQEGLNKQGGQLSLGALAGATKNKMLQEMLSGQKGVKKSLNQLMKEMKNSGGNKTGNLSGIAHEIDKVLEDLQKKNFSKETYDRQQKILSRMLESKTSITQRGEKDERKSYTSDQNFVLNGTNSLPFNKGQKEDITLRALNDAINAGYSKQHQSMIKRYFNTLSQENINSEK